MTNDVEQFFMYLLLILTSFSVKLLFKSSTDFSRVLSGSQQNYMNVQFSRTHSHPQYQHPSPGGTCVTINDPTLTHHLKF